MARRWELRLVTVVAGPGFGKTALLVSAMAESSDDRDVWLACEPADADGDVLLAGVATALRLDRCHAVDDIARAVWLRAPNRVCLIFDDVHEIPPRSAGAALLRRLVAELPRNGHVVLASRAPVPLPVARLAARRQLERILETDLLFDESELASFADAREVGVDVLSSSGGWPAVAELAATAGSDLVFEFVWEEVLATLGDARVHRLARFAAAGGGDDAVAAAVVAGDVEELVAGVPLVERGGSGWATLHPLWGPVLRRVLSEDEADECRRRAAVVHRDAGRYDGAIALFADSRAWDDVLATIRLATLEPALRIDGPTFGRWHRMLPSAYRHRPEAQFAAGLELTARLPLAAAQQFTDARAGFRTVDDVDGEVAVITHDGLMRWWANDFVGLAELLERVTTLAAGGSTGASMLLDVGAAAIAHIGADSEGVLTALSGLDDSVLGGWAGTVHWLRHVAYRRAGDLDRAELTIDLAESLPQSLPDQQVVLARLRTDWLRGRVDHVRECLPEVELHYRSAGNRFLHVEVALELAAHLAWLGARDRAQALLDETTPMMADMPGALAQILRLIASVGVAVVDGDEAAATALLEADPHAVPGRTDNWYWRDRAAVALPYVLLPRWRDDWDGETHSATHRIGIELAHALVAARGGDLSTVRALGWPDPGTARAHLPLRWLGELAAAGIVVGNPPPGALVDALGDSLRPALSRIVTVSSPPAAGTAAADLLAHIAAPSGHCLTIRVLGPLELQIDGVTVDHPDLHRRRVRELLCLLVARRRVRREVAADLLWPELANARHNLRVTLNYLQRVLEPDRPRTEPGYFLRTGNDALALYPSDRLRCDVWELAAHLDRAEQAERAGDPATAVTVYQAALPLWRGDPYDDVADLDWARDEQAHWRERYTLSALRAGELLLATGSSREAALAAERAITADPTAERGYQLLARSHLASGDPRGAHRALDTCLRTCAELDLEPGAVTVDLLARLTGAAAR